MRHITLAAAFVSLFAANAEAESPTFETVSTLPCRAYLALANSDFVSVVLGPVQEHIQKRQRTDTLMSQCVIEGYLLMACKRTPQKTIGGVVSTILEQERTRSLPPARRCGA